MEYFIPQELPTWGRECTGIKMGILQKAKIYGNPEHFEFNALICQ